MKGFCTQHSKDIHIYPLNNHYNIVYWGGDAAEACGLWNFQISPSRPVVFDPTRDRQVNLSEERIAIFVAVGRLRIQLSEGLFLVREGSHVEVDFISTHGTITIPITFPTRQSPLSVILPL
jgi:hypothetical protein